MDAGGRELAVQLTGRPLIRSTTPALQRALEASAAGGHHLQMVGRHGLDLLARALPPLLPDLDQQQALEVTAIHSAAGALGEHSGLITRPPFRSPHSPGSRAVLVGGGGRPARPGEMALAHRGILHLADATDFDATTLNALHGPMETGEVEVTRGCSTLRFPARFTLVLTGAPCPCGAAARKDCACEPALRHRYLARLSGPLLDRIDIKVRVPDDGLGDPLRRPGGEASTMVPERVTHARDRAARRLAGTPWRTNSEISSLELRRCYRPSPAAGEPLEDAVRAGALSMRGAERVIRLAWTLADLAGHDDPTAQEVTEAGELFLSSPE